MSDNKIKDINLGGCKEIKDLDIDNNARSIDLNEYFPDIDMNKVIFLTTDVVKNGIKLKWENPPSRIR